MKKNKIRVRFAPSPTGQPHIGSIRTALYNWLFAKNNKGKFILRIEDTDRKRLVPDSLNGIYQAMAWLGITPDEGPTQGGDYEPYQQSDRLSIYQPYVSKLIKEKKAYYCFCLPERLEKLRQTQKNTKQPTRYDGHCLRFSDNEIKEKLAKKESSVVRLKVPAVGDTSVNDLVRGRVTVSNELIDHQILVKSDGYPTYHLASVIDDHLMEISHVIRAEEWLPSTPKHVLLYQAFGWTPPMFAHLSMIIGNDKAKLSKRHGATATLEYRDMGIVPAAMISFLALLGWNPGTEQEIFSKDDLIKQFSLAKLNKSPAVFNIEKLKAINAKIIRTMPADELIKLAEPYLLEYQAYDSAKLISLFQDRIDQLNEIPGRLNYLNNLPDYEAGLLVPKQGSAEKAKKHLTDVLMEINNLSEIISDADKLRKHF
ncbi:MAG: glutamate--tRNA ligase, partial [Patescibacteria group bacterium]